MEIYLNAIWCLISGLMTRRILPLLLLLAPLMARAELVIDITQGVRDPVPIAIVPFAHAMPADAGADPAAVVQHDLDSSGRFKSMARTAMTAQPTRGSEVVAADWRGAGNYYVLVGRVVVVEGKAAIECELLNVLTGQPLGGTRISAGAGGLRSVAHQISDFVFEKIVGARGAFNTHIAYVSVDGAPPAQRFQLIVADADGENPRVILASRLPIMSPAWSPDGQWLAYVSFENRISAVYVQQLRTGERRRVSAHAGVNGAPAYSPDGRQLALTLSGSGGNLDIYVLDLGTQALRRVTDDSAIDTEPSWSNDGKQIYFTSDRAGGPQIYRLDVAAPTHVQRLSFGGSYNARPRLSPDGSTLALVTRDGSAYRIAVQDASGNLRTLTRGTLDESPSFAPNGISLIYAGRQNGQGTLATVSVDGLVAQRLKSDQGDVREPVWGPFLKE
jgi:TolB protein